MSLNVLIVPDKFKGTLSATQAAQVIAAGWHSVRPGDRLELLPMSDGGDGFGEILAQQLTAEERTVHTVDAAHRPIRAKWWWAPGSRTAIVESARVIGLAMLPPLKYHPFELDTWGLGALLRYVARKRPSTCLIGIGGSATNDGGFGMARALGWRFLDDKGQAIESWTDLRVLARIETPSNPVQFSTVKVAVDVRNRLLGARGATLVYGPQKGIRPVDVDRAELCLQRLVRMVAKQSFRGNRPSCIAGAGAAGGLGFGLHVFLGAPLVSGFRLFAEHAGLESEIRRFQLVVTGEGAIDRSSLSMGKGVGEIASLCARNRIPCIGLAGSITDASLARERFSFVSAMTPGLTTLEAAMSQPVLWLERLASNAARSWSSRSTK